MSEFCYHSLWQSDIPDWSKCAKEIPAACQQQMAALRARFAAEQRNNVTDKEARARFKVMGNAVPCGECGAEAALSCSFGRYRVVCSRGCFPGCGGYVPNLVSVAIRQWNDRKGLNRTPLMEADAAEQAQNIA